MITKKRVRKLVVKKPRKRAKAPTRKLRLKKRIIVRKKGRAVRRLKRFPGRKGRRIVARRRRETPTIVRKPRGSERARRTQLAYKRAFDEAFNSGYHVGFAQGYNLELTNPTV